MVVVRAANATLQFSPSYVIYICVQDLCIRQAQSLHTKSSLVEEAANELINMLLEFDHNQREEVEKIEEESCAESRTIDQIDSEGILTF